MPSPFPLPRPTPRKEGVPCVYLAGAIEQAADGGIAWRRNLARILQEDLGHRVLDPTHHELEILTPEELREFRNWKNSPDRWPRFLEVVRRIIHRDAHLILAETDYIIAYWDAAVLGGGGTHGELTLAFLFGIPVYLVLDLPRERVSSWILGCCEEVFESFEVLAERLKTLEKEGRFRLPLSLRSGEAASSPPVEPLEAE